MSRLEQAAEILRRTGPAITTLDDVRLSPLIDSSKMVIRFCAEPPHPALGHFRQDVDVTSLESFVDHGIDRFEAIGRPMLYGGIIFPHFGHFLAETIHRLWPRLAFPELRQIPVAFHIFTNSAEPLPPFAADIFTMLGLDMKDVVVIDRPIHFQKLLVPPQGRTMTGPSISGAYQTLLGRDAPPSSQTERLYFSRRHYLHSGSFYGESYIEQLLAAAGFDILFPEALPVTECVERLRRADVAIFAEGSAIHVLELCGADVPKTLVIGRRPGSTERFTPLLSDAVPQWRIAEYLTGAAGLAESRKKYSSFVDLTAIHREIEDFTGAILPPFDAEQADLCIRRDAFALMRDRRAFPDDILIETLRLNLKRFIAALARATDPPSS